MAASVQFIIGRAGSGKTRRIYEALAENERRGRRSLLIVPDRATFETERELSRFLGGGLLFTSVVSFTRLAARVLGDSGDARAYLSKQGRMMLIRRVLDETANELQLFKRVGLKRGFAEECDEIILKCKRFSITPDELSSAEGLPEQLTEKLRDFALVYSRLAERMEDRYIDGEDRINAMIDLLPASRAKGAAVFVDAPDMMNAQSVRIIDALFRTASSVTLTFRMDPDGNAPDVPLFRPDELSYRRLLELAKAAGCTAETVRLTGNHRAESPSLAALERNLFAYPYTKFTDDAMNIELHSSYGRDDEVREAAERIMFAVRGGMRYRDISVAVSDLAGYAPILRRYFGRCGIPMFLDAKRAVSDHPIAELITAALRCAEKNFRSEDFIRVLKTELSGISHDSAEKLENHILKFGLEGKRLYETEPSVKNHDDISDFEELEAARLTVAEPILALKNSLSEEGRGAEHRVRALYGYLSALDVAEKLRLECEELKKSPEMLGYALENQQIYDTIIELFDQIPVILGDEPIGLAKFASVVEEGLAAYEVGVIPTTLDQVLVSDISSIHTPECRLLLVLGTNDGHIPRVRSDNSIISDRELGLMRAAGLNAWETTESMNAGEDLNLYTVLSKAKEALYLSYCRVNGTETFVPSAVIGRIGSVFAHCLRTSGLLSRRIGSAEEAAFADLAVLLRRYLDTGNEDPALPALYAHFAAEPQYKAAMEALESMFFPELSSEPLGQDAALRLYGRHGAGSPTRLEIFNRCPFRYLMEYGLKLRERELRQERQTDYGTLVHNALDLLINGYIEEKTDFSALTKESVAERLDSILPALFEEHNGGIYLDSGRMRSQAERIRERLVNISWTLVRQIADGSFRPYASELSFGRPGDELPALELRSGGISFRITGIVDRVDTLKLDGDSYYRIIDYKTGDTKFDFTALAAGVRLQLPLYAAAVQAALSTEEKYRTAGLYYLHTADLSTLEGDDEKDEKARRSELRLRGLTLREEDIITASDGTDFRFSGVIQGLRSGDGGYTGAGLVTAEEMERAIAYAKSVGSGTLDRIMDGRAEISPCVDGGKAACSTCAFGSICRFDTTAGNKYRRLRSVSEDKFFGRKDKNQ